ncbi:hypothetical protein AB834_03135 [PVC group bacterium (ex Bugula neritina AB1)]|nr:hypothetical protein AB834_03135 [PVC group bacterium (ex Bugula neritina AB1)]
MNLLIFKLIIVNIFICLNAIGLPPEESVFHLITCKESKEENLFDLFDQSSAVETEKTHCSMKFITENGKEFCIKKVLRKQGASPYREFHFKENPESFFLNLPKHPLIYNIIKFNKNEDYYIYITEKLSDSFEDDFYNPNVPTLKKKEMLLDILLTYIFLLQNSYVRIDLQPENLLIDKNGNVIFIDLDDTRIDKSFTLKGTFVNESSSLFKKEELFFVLYNTCEPEHLLYRFLVVLSQKISDQSFLQEMKALLLNPMRKVIYEKSQEKVSLHSYFLNIFKSKYFDELKSSQKCRTLVNLLKDNDEYVDHLNRFGEKKLTSTSS